MAGRDMALQHQPFLMTSLKSLQSQHMYDSRFHVSFICSNRENERETERERERQRERERERERESLLYVWQYFYCNRTIVQTSVFWNTFCSRVWIFESKVWLRSDWSITREQRCSTCAIIQTLQALNFWTQWPWLKREEEYLDMTKNKRIMNKIHKKELYSTDISIQSTISQRISARSTTRL